MFTIDVMIYFALAVFIMSVWMAVIIGVGCQRLGRLEDVAAHLPGAESPSVSIIIPACNEARSIEPALRSVLDLAYDQLEIIVVNDRSTDATGTIIEKMKCRYPRLQICHINELPAGWLGKNHAMHVGAQRAKGDYLLFTDADIVMEKSTVTRAVNRMLSRNLDHLCLIFESKSRSRLLNALIIDAAGSLLLLFRPWHASNPDSKRYMGVGAFNMVKTAAYRKSGGHIPVAMCPVDDIMLGKNLKRQGFRQECMLGFGFVSVEWYASVPEMVQGLQKNTFAVFDYSVVKLVAGLAVNFLFGILPAWVVLAGIFVPERIDSGVVLFFSMALIVRLISAGKGFFDSGLNPLHAFWSLLTPYLTMYTVAKAAVTTLWRNGICWRGTFYPLEELRKGMLR